MIKYKQGNLLESGAQALVNTVNTVGVMGKGVALQFKKQFPENFKEYAKACKDGRIGIGKLLVVKDSSLLHGEKIIINFPTKTDWRKTSEYSYIESGLKDLVRIIKENNIKSIALPPLGSGNGGLDWERVKDLLNKNLSEIDIEVIVYEPNFEIKEKMKGERVKLTTARAMLLAVLYDLVRNGEFVSEFACEKICYFLQRFGAEDVFKLEYKPNFYGPYSGKVKYVLYYLNGSYISGYSSMDKKPFEELGLAMDSEDEVTEYLSKEENTKYLNIVNKTKEFLSGFYSSFGLELLSTIDYINNRDKSSKKEDIKKALNEWSSRKRTMLSNDEYLDKSIMKLENAGLIQ